MDPPPLLISPPDRIVWPILLPGMVLTAIIALSVHVVMLEVLHIPYPSAYPRTGWLIYLNAAAGVLAIIYFYDLARARLGRLSIPWRCLALFALVAMLRESLIRAPLMDGVTTTAWVYSAVKSLPRLTQILLVCCLVVLSAPKLDQTWQKVVAAFFFAALASFACKPLVDAGFKHLLEALPYKDHDEIYATPYPWQVKVPAYLSFAEPVVACFLVAALVWNRLSAKPMARVFQFTLLIMLLKGSLFSPFINILYADTDALSATLSMGQFSLETLALALLTAIVWQLCRRPALM